MRMVNLSSHSDCKQPISIMAFWGTWWVGSSKKQLLLWGSSVLAGKAGASNSLRNVQLHLVHCHTTFTCALKVLGL